MPNMDAEAISQRDNRFAARLQKKDRYAMVDIDRAYAPAIHKLLAPKLGPKFKEEDIDEIIQNVLMHVWKKFDPSRGMSLRSYIFQNAKFLAASVLREKYRAPVFAAINVGKASEPSSTDFRPERNLETKALTIAEVRVLDLVTECLASLSDKQRTAFDRRFYSKDTRWAKKLEMETGVKARTWSKSAVDAKNKVEAFLIDNGVRYNEEEGYYEVA